MNIIIGIALGLCFFIATITAYTVGLKHGKQLSNGIIPKINLNPIQAVREHQEAKVEQVAKDKMLKGIENILAYDGTPQKEVKE